MSTDERLKILVVDDRQENLAAMSRLLERPDLEVLTARGGNEALGLMLDHELALVLLDVQMPGMNGFEVAELMRRNERTSHVPIIFVTAINKERRQIFSGYEAGAVDYLFKPVDPFIIRAKVNVFLEMRRAQLAREQLLRELNRANNRLQELSDRKSDYLAAASHELRTPLTVIKEHCNLVHGGVVGDLNDDQRHCLGVALRNCNRLADLVNDLLDLDGIESGNTVRVRRSVDLGELLATTVEDFTECCAAEEQTIVLDLPADLPPVLADPALVTQVLVNFVGNAHKFTPAAGTITLRARRCEGGVRCEVVDTGPGIPVEERGRVFEKFAQLGRRGSGQKKGTGLGLAIARRIVELHDGTIGVEGEAGAGAVFHATLPVFDDRAHLRAFVADGMQAPGAADGEWSLVLLAPAEHGPAAELTAAVHGVIRQGIDRVALVRHEGRELAAVLVAAGRDGSLAFLSRLEPELEHLGGPAGDVGFVILPVDRQQSGNFALHENDLRFAPLRLSLPAAGQRIGGEAG